MKKNFMKDSEIQTSNMEKGWGGRIQAQMERDCHRNRCHEETNY